LAKISRSLLLYTGVATLLVGVITFIIPYLEDAANRMIRSPAWWTKNAGAVAWFWGPADPSIGLYAPFWMFSTGLIVVGLALGGISYTVKS
jgi:hypothetical protein